jgi:putative hydrolase of the HAD superfamily
MSSFRKTLIKGVVFDLDNTLLDFMKMKQVAVRSAIRGMIEAGLEIDEKKSFDNMISFHLFQDQPQSSP